MNVRAENLTMSFGDRTVFENVSFSIPAGSITGIVGESGIGKSTLAKLLCGIYRPRSGSIYLDGELLSSPSGYDRKSGERIQMVYQQPHASLDGSQRLKNGFTELIRYHKFAPDRASANALIKNALRDVGLDTGILGHRPHQISGGEAQRIAIARCLLFKPQLLILDEATSMLDVSTQANVCALVTQAMEKNGGSVLLISHDAELVEHMCDRIYRFEEKTLGRIR